MAMKPFCRLQLRRLLGHWLSLEGKTEASRRELFHVNWFRQDDDGRFLWPGFGDNLRVLRWIVDRCAGRSGARETPIGFLPEPRDLDVRGLALGEDTLGKLLEVDPAAWRAEMDDIAGYLDDFGNRVPDTLTGEQRKTRAALG